MDPLRHSSKTPFVEVNLARINPQGLIMDDKKPDEVASVHRIGLDTIEDADAFSFTTIPESTRHVIRFRHAGQFIHAPTAALIYQFREVLAGRDTRVAELEQPVFTWK